MIYLIEGLGYGPGGIEEEYKIGYTSDVKSRLDTYRTHNPTCRVLFQIPLWSEKLENKIHKFFDHLEHVGDMKEWYVRDIRIKRFFERFKDSKEGDVEAYIDEILRVRSYGYPLDGDDVDFLKKYWFDCKTKQERLKYLYEAIPEVSYDDLNKIEEDVRNFCESVKKSKAEDLGYDLKLVREEYIKGNKLLQEFIKDNFEVGEIYSENKINNFLKDWELTIEDLHLFNLDPKEVNIVEESFSVKKYYLINNLK